MDHFPPCAYLCKQFALVHSIMRLRNILLACLFPALGFSQPSVTADPNPAPVDSVEILADSLAAVNELHGPYVGFTGTVTGQYKNFVALVGIAGPEELLELMGHPNAVVRGYAFWALAREQYDSLDSVLLAHARDEVPVRVMQGGMVTELPLVDFMQWVVNPDLLDGDCKKLDTEVIDRVAELRFSDH